MGKSTHALLVDMLTEELYFSNEVKWWNNMRKYEQNAIFIFEESQLFYYVTLGQKFNWYEPHFPIIK